MFGAFRLVIAVCLISMIVAGCGGGSSGGGGNNGFSVSPTSLTFNAQVDAATPADQIITLTASQPQSEIPNLSANAAAIDYVSLNVINSTTLEVTVKVVSPISLGVGSYSASVNISSSQYSVSVPITYNVTAIPPGDPEVHFVYPHIIAPGSAQPVVIRGSGFARFDSGNLPAVTIGGEAASNVSVVNDSEIRATTPAFSAGNYAVAVQGGGITFTSTASIVVMADQTYATTSYMTTGEKSRLIFDKQRQAVYVVNTTSGNLERYQYQSGTTWNVDTVSLSGLTDAALSPDGNTLVLIDGSSFYEVDPSAATMTVGSGVAATLEFSDTLDRVISANNGTMYAITDNQWSAIYMYDIVGDSVSVHTYFNSSFNEVTTSVYRPWLFADSDLGQIYFGEHGSTGSRLYQLDASDNAYADTGLPVVSFDGYYDMAFNADSSLILINGKDIYNANLTTLLGSLPQVHTSSTVTADGSTAYVHLDFQNILRAYDISNPALPVQIGGDVNLTNTAGMRTKMRISDDDNTLFLVGTDYLHIIDLTSFSF